MHFKPALIFSFLFASVVFANLRRRKHPHNNDAKLATISERDFYNYRWSGAVMTGDFATVSADFTVPSPVGNSGSSASAWVGIGGYMECSNSLLNVGVDFTVGGNGEPEYQGWYEWLGPNGATLVDIPIAAGDDIKLTIVLWSLTEALVGIENVSKNDSRAFSVPSNTPLCDHTAEWIVEDYEQNGGLVPFTDFGTVTFRNAEAALLGQAPVSPSVGAEIVTIIQSDGTPLTFTSIDGSSVKVTRV